MASRILLVALSLLASAATAHAECAWVLWEEEERNVLPGKGPEVKWAAPVAYSGRVACVAELETNAKTWESIASTIAKNHKDPDMFVARPPSGTVIELHSRFKNGAWVANRLRCLPDTVDPRGPKGK